MALLSSYGYREYITRSYAELFYENLILQFYFISTYVRTG